MKAFLLLSLVCFTFQGMAQNKDSIIAAQSNLPGVKYIKIYNDKYGVWTKKEGNGKNVLLLLHGGPGSSPEYLENVYTNLGKDYTVYTFAQLGTIFSDVPQDTTLATVEKFVEQVEEVRKALGLQKFNLLGHSWGSLLGLAYAARYPQHIQKLIMSNASVYALGRNQQ